MLKASPINFNAEGVTVTVPAQKNKKGKVVKLLVGSLNDMRPVPGGFQPRRLVINVVVEDEDAPGTYRAEFDPPLELKVRYTKADQDLAQRAGRPLTLAFWDGSQWVRFTRAKHQFELQPDANPQSGGLGSVKISRWGDPPVAWGD
jgi:hypothetical protein